MRKIRSMKRFVAAMLSGIMVVSMMPVSVLADTGVPGTFR